LAHPNESIGLEFRRISKASNAYVTSTYSATLEHDRIDEREAVIAISEKSEEEQKELQAALITIESEQTTETENTIAAADRALDRVVTNALIILAVTMSSGFSV
jgi:hypothetical protein